MITDLACRPRRPVPLPLPRLRLPARLAMALAAALALLVLLAGAVIGGASGPAPSYEVRSGDTLWSIAADRYGPSETRSRVEQIVSLNHLDGAALTPGQMLVLPAG